MVRAVCGVEELEVIDLTGRARHDRISAARTNNQNASETFRDALAPRLGCVSLQCI